MIIINIFQSYYELLTSPNTGVATWSATIATLTFIITFFIKPWRSWKRIVSYFKRNPKLTFNDLEIKYNSDELKKKVRILVVDDEVIFPVNGFKEFGYNIQQWTKLDESKLKQLRDGSFDIIILDILGVAEDIAENDGFDVLQDLKNHNPSQIIVAYSGSTFNCIFHLYKLLVHTQKCPPFYSCNLVSQQLGITGNFTFPFRAA